MVILLLFLVEEMVVYTGDVKDFTFGDGCIFVLHAREILKFDGKRWEVVAGFGGEESDVKNPVCVDYSDGVLYVLEPDRRLIKAYDRDGNFLKDYFLDAVVSPVSMCVGERIYLFDRTGMKCFSYDTTDGVVEFFDDIFKSPTGLAYQRGTVYVLDGDELKIFSEDGDFIQSYTLRNGTSFAVVDKYQAICDGRMVYLYQGYRIKERLPGQKIKGKKSWLGVYDGEKIVIYRIK